MKNTLKYFYNIEVDSIRQVDDNYYIAVGRMRYLFSPYYGDSIDELYKIVRFNKLFNEIIMNKDNSLITVINKKNYVLQLLKYCDNEIDMKDIENFNYEVIGEYPKIVRNNWGLMWSSKIDYIEYQISQFGKKYSLISKNFDYYCGLTENAIQLFNYSKKNSKIFICHNRIKKVYTLNDLYNPLNIVLDYKVRDSAEYLKDLFYNGFDIKKLLDDITNSLSFDDNILFFIRFLFPSYFFDIYDQVLLESIDEKSINKIIVNVEKYEELIKYLYNLIRKKMPIMDIEWLNN